MFQDGINIFLADEKLIGAQEIQLFQFFLVKLIAGDLADHIT